MNNEPLKTQKNAEFLYKGYIMRGILKVIHLISHMLKQKNTFIQRFSAISAAKNKKTQL